MGTQDPELARRDRGQFVERLARAHLAVPQADIAEIDVYSPYVSFWDEQFRLVEINRSLLMNGMADHSRPSGDILGRRVDDYLPDLDELGYRDEFIKVHFNGGSCEIGDYQFKGFNLKPEVHCRVTISKADDLTVIIGEDISSEIAHEFQVQNYLKMIESIENERRQLEVTVDVLARRLASLGEESSRQCCQNVESVVLPFLEMLSATPLSPNQREILAMLEENVSGITRELDSAAMAYGTVMTPREVQIANLIRMGKTTKEIAQLLQLSCRTVDSHRANIRHKLGIQHQDRNLRTSLTSTLGVNACS